MSRFTNGPPEMLYKKSCSYKFHNVHRKTSVLEFFLKLQALMLSVNISKILSTRILKNICEQLLLFIS